MHTILLPYYVVSPLELAVKTNGNYYFYFSKSKCTSLTSYAQNKILSLNSLCQQQYTRSFCYVATSLIAQSIVEVQNVLCAPLVSSFLTGRTVWHVAFNSSRIIAIITTSPRIFFDGQGIDELITMCIVLNFLRPSMQAICYFFLSYSVVTIQLLFI